MIENKECIKEVNVKAFSLFRTAWIIIWLRIAIFLRSFVYRLSSYQLVYSKNYIHYNFIGLIVHIFSNPHFSFFTPIILSLLLLRRLNYIPSSIAAYTCYIFHLFFFARSFSVFINFIVV